MKSLMRTAMRFQGTLPDSYPGLAAAVGSSLENSMTDRAPLKPNINFFHYGNTINTKLRTVHQD